MAGRTDTASRLIAAPASRLYQAMVDAGQLLQWLPPTGMTGTMAEFDPRPGGQYRMTLRYDDAAVAGKSGANEDIVAARFLDLVPDRRVVQEIDFVSDDPRFSGTMTMTWELVPAGDRTEVRIIAANVPEGISPADHAEGMAASLANLARFVEG